MKWQSERAVVAGRASLTPALAFALITALWLFAMEARAAELTFGNPALISIQDNTNAAPYPSTVTVSGINASVDKITVTLSNLTHPFPADLDLLLVGPGGQKVLLLSDAGTPASTNETAGVTNVTLTFDDAAPVQLRQFGRLTRGTYRPTDYPPNDAFLFQAPSGPYATNLAVFQETSPNGTWQLYAMDDQPGSAGTIGGWSLKVRTHSQVFTNFNPVIVTNAASAGAPYPSVINTTNVFGVVSTVTVTLLGLTHPHPSDLDLLLVGPGGESLVLMSDAGAGFSVSNINLTFDDSALAPPPQNVALPSGSFFPTNYGAIDAFSFPAPAGPYGSALSGFNGKQANGAWQLFVVDDSPQSDAGQIAGWKLAISTEPLAITQQPAGATVFPGSNVTFQVSVAGQLPVTYQWLLNGINIPGATNSTLAIDSVRVRDAGSYTVLVTGGSGVTVSDPALLQIGYPLNLAPDSFAQRRILLGDYGLSLGTNFFATKEPGEFAHAGEPGGSSVWYSWIPNTTGIATFDTRGSTFSTLLGIYTGNVLSNLTLAAADEAHGGFHTSLASFNADANREYLIAVDGLGGQQGSFVLNWILEPTADLLPYIYLHPGDLAVTQGDDAELAVGVLDPVGVTYQWLLNGVPIFGATNDFLLRTNVQIQDVGAYEVLVARGARSVKSGAGVLEIGPEPLVQSRAQVEHITNPGHVISLGPMPMVLCDTCSIPPVFISVRAGLGGGTQGINNSDGHVAYVTDAAHSPCSVVLNHAKYLGLEAVGDGDFFIDTAGSLIPTALVVFELVNDDGLVPGNIKGCDHGDPLLSRPSATHFHASPGVKYMVAVGGLGGGDIGGIRINWSFGVPLTVAPAAGNSAALSWVAALDAYALQSAAALPTAPPFSGWQPVTQFVSSNFNGGTNFRVVQMPVPPPAGTTNRLFRLIKTSP